MPTTPLIACHECDLVHRFPSSFDRGTARCSRCGAVLARRKADTVERTLALAVTGLVLFAVANGFPFLSFEMEGSILETNLITGIRVLFGQGLRGLAMLVFFTTIASPLAVLAGTLYALVPLKLGIRLPGMARVLRWVRHFRSWAMLEVFMLGMLVSLAKLTKNGTIVPGAAVFAFMALIFALAAMSAAYDPHQVWRRLERLP